MTTEEMLLPIFELFLEVTMSKYQYGSTHEQLLCLNTILHLVIDNMIFNTTNR